MRETDYLATFVGMLVNIVSMCTPRSDKLLAVRLTYLLPRQKTGRLSSSKIRFANDHSLTEAKKHTNFIPKEMTQCIISVLPDLTGLYQLDLPVLARALLELCHTLSCVP